MDLLDKIDKITTEMMNPKMLSMISGKVSSQEKKASQFKKGDIVNHSKYGKGVIKNIGKNKLVTMLTVKFSKDKKILPSHEFDEGV